jgi:hypothetical protein
VWQLTTTITCTHTRNEKKRFQKKGFKVMEAIITRNVENTTLIPLTHVYQPTLDNDGACDVWSQHLPNVIYAMKFPFTEIICCTCEWALRGNMCKHQIVVIFTCTWYGSHRGELGHMFVDPQHIPNDMESNDDDKVEHLESDDGIMEFDGLMNMEQNDVPMDAIVGSNDTISSSTLMERALA